MTTARDMEEVYMNGVMDGAMGESCRAFYVLVLDYDGGPELGPCDIKSYIWISDEWGRDDLEVFDTAGAAQEAWNAYAAEVDADDTEEGGEQ